MATLYVTSWLVLTMVIGGLALYSTTLASSMLRLTSGIGDVKIDITHSVVAINFLSINLA